MTFVSLHNGGILLTVVHRVGVCARVCVCPLKQSLSFPADLRANLSPCQDWVTWRSVTSFSMWRPRMSARTEVCRHIWSFLKKNWEITKEKDSNRIPACAWRHACTSSRRIHICTPHMFVYSYMSLGRWSMLIRSRGAGAWHGSQRATQMIHQCPRDFE